MSSEQILRLSKGYVTVAISSRRFWEDDEYEDEDDHTVLVWEEEECTEGITSEENPTPTP